MNMLIRRAAAEGIDYHGLKAAIRALGERITDRIEDGDEGVMFEATFRGLDRRWVEGAAEEWLRNGGILVSTEMDVYTWPGMRADVAREIGAEMSTTFHRAFDSAMAELQQPYRDMLRREALGWAA